MTAAKHTPGPWEASQGSNRGNIGIKARGAAELFRVAYVPVLPMDDLPEEAQANARLIAAAPELLAACRAALETGVHAIGCAYSAHMKPRLKKEAGPGRDRETARLEASAPPCSCHIGLLGAAIAKATGGGR